jgi:L,D-transpeptidase-like protein
VLKSQLKLHGVFVRAALILASVVLLADARTSAREDRAVRTSAPVAGGVFHATAWKSSRLGAIDPRVLNLALNAASCAVQSGRSANPTTLTVIDYSKPSTQKRLWVIDLQTRTLLFEELVAHGQGSGNNMATAFSNDADTHRSSIGLFETKEAYIGKNGYSLRLEGLEAGFNDHAMDRAIVMHGAAYVSDAIARKQGRLGRSWGCPAVRENVAHDLIDRVKDSGLVFAYYPDPSWLAASQFLNNCYGAPGAAPVVATG